MDSVSILTPNEVISCLWNKNAREKCRIGLSDAILYDNCMPSKWYFTGKNGEVLKKKAVALAPVSERWKKIASASNSNIIAILRQEHGLLKFFREPVWSRWCDHHFTDVDNSVISLHCFIRGTTNLVYRNYYELKDKYGKFITATKTYKLNIDVENADEAVSMMTPEDYVFTELKAANIRSVMDLATSTIIKYMEMMLQIRVVSLYVDYVIDTKSQLWVLWTSEARVFQKPVSTYDRTHATMSLPRELEQDSMAPGQVELALNVVNDMKSESRGFRTAVGGLGQGDASAGFKIVKAPEFQVNTSQCKGDFCSIHLQSVGSLASQEEVSQNTMEHFFTEEEQLLLKRYDRYKSMSDVSEQSIQYEHIPMRSVLLAREERRGTRLQEGGRESWREYPSSPREEGQLFAHTVATSSNKNDKEEEDNILHSESEADKLDILAKDKLRRETFGNGLLSYYDSVKVCPTCYKVYLLLDWARETLAQDSHPHGDIKSNIRTKRTSQNTALVLKDSDVSVASEGRSLIRTKRNAKEGQNSITKLHKRTPTWKSYVASTAKGSNTTGGFLDLDSYLRGKGGGVIPGGNSSDEEENARSHRLIPEHVYRGNVLVAFNDPDLAQPLVDILREAHFNVSQCSDGRQVVNQVLERACQPRESRQHVDCILLQQELNLSDAFATTKSIREYERSVRQKESASLAGGGSGQLPLPHRTPIICCSVNTSTETLQTLMRADMDGCLSYPVDKVALLNTVRAAVPHHLANLEQPAPPEEGSREQRVFRMGPMGIKEGSNDSSASAYKGLSTSKSKEDDCAYNGLAQLDADTVIPFIVMDASRHSNVQIKNRQAVFNLVVCHDLFDTAERLKIFLRPIVEKYAGIQVLLWNYPGQAFTEWRSEQLLNNEYHAICLNEVLGQIGHLGTNDFDTSHPFYILGYGHGMSVATFYAAHYNIPNLRGIVSVNGWSFLDSYMAGVMHDCINIFECAPPARPDLPVYFFSRFLFSREYLAKASVPLALNIYTAVHNPISIRGRIALCKGVLQTVDMRSVLNEIDRALICIQSTQDSFTRPLHVEPFVANRGGEVKSIHAALDDPTRTCVIWIKAGHELFQEKRTDTLMLLEQILTGFHELHNVNVPSALAVDGELGATIAEGGISVKTSITNETFGNAVEDRFINNVLKSMDKVKATQPPSQYSSGHQVMAGLLQSVNKPSGGGNFTHVKHDPSVVNVSDPTVWLEYSKGVSETQLVKKADTLRRGAQGEAQTVDAPLIVLDPTSVLFDKQDSTNRSTKPNTLTRKMNASEFPEVKEYMSWRLKRNKRRLQRLQAAARIIQCAFRCYMARKRVRIIRMTRAAKIIQRYFRGWLGRQKFLEHARLLWAVQMVQMYWRGYSARKKHFFMKLEIAAAVTIQKTFRGYRGRLLVAAKRKKQARAASVIQALYRRVRARKDVFRMRLERNKATVIQRVYRGRLGRKKAAAELDKYIFSRSQTQGIEFGRQMLLEHKLHATKLQSDVALLAQEKVASEELVEQLLDEISSFEEGVRTLEKDMHRLSKVEADAAAFMDDDSKYELREQKMRLDKEFGSMLAKISNRKDALNDLEKKLAMIDKFRLKKEEELRTLERKLVVLLEEQQNELNAIKKKQDIRGNMLIASHDELAGVAAPSSSSNNGSTSTALVVGGNSRGGGGGPSMQEKRQAAQLMQSTETLMKFGFMSMSMTYFSSLNMIKALRTVSAQDTVMAALADVHAQKATSFGMNAGGGGVPSGGAGGGGGGSTNFIPDLKRGQLPGQETLRVSAWSVDDVSKWLDTLTLGQYKEAFIDAAIDGEFLYDLDEEDLKNTLGIEHRLHRKKILNCVQRLKVAEAQEDSKLEALLRDTNAMDAAFVESASPARSFASLDAMSVGTGAGGGGGGDGRNEPKISLPELVTLVRHSKYNRVKEALDYLPTKRFDPSVVESQYVPNHGTVYSDAYERVPFHINRGSDHSNTLLIIAAQNGNQKIVKYLISKGANPNHQNDHGQTAAHFAVEYKFFDISTWLFENGALDYLENMYGLTAYDGISRGEVEQALIEE